MKLSDKSWVSVGMLLTALGVTTGSVTTFVGLQKDVYANTKNLNDLKAESSMDRKEMRDTVQKIFERLRSIENNVSEINGALRRRDK